jgi:hypothetical protein
MQEPVAVKALEWECVVGDVEVAGSYKIDRMRPLLSGKPKKYWVQIALGFGLETVATLCSTLDEAKAAAQADYEQRVRSALSTSKSDPAPEIAALRAAIERLLGALATIIEKNQEREFMGDDASDGYGNRGWVVRDGQYARIARASVAPEQEGAK